VDADCQDAFLQVNRKISYLTDRLTQQLGEASKQLERLNNDLASRLTADVAARVRVSDARITDLELSLQKKIEREVAAHFGAINSAITRLTEQVANYKKSTDTQIRALKR
jgi:hypothetical protein